MKKKFTLTVSKPSIPIREPSVPLSNFGKDHWSTFAYLDHCAVDHKGEIDRIRMRCNPDIHPGLAFKTFDKEYPTRLKNGEEKFGHDDWSCFEDLEAVGLVKWEGTGINPIVVFTDLGIKVISDLRQHKAAGKLFNDFCWNG